MYALDRRRVAIHIYSRLGSLRKTAILLGVSHSTVSRWINHPNRKQYTRQQPSKSTIIADPVRMALACNPFLSLWQLRDALGVPVSKELIRTVIKRLGVTKKKARFHGQPKDLEEKTRLFVQYREEHLQHGRRFISLDETSFGRHGRPVYGYAPRGQQLLVKRKQARTTTVSSLAAVSQDGIVQYATKPGSYNSVSFIQTLGSFNLPRDSVVLLDNVAFHRSAAVAKFAQEHGLHLLYTPPYSPWFNPIEGVFSVVKRHFYQHSDVAAAYGAVKVAHVTSFFRKSFSLQASPQLWCPQDWEGTPRQ